MWYTQIQLCTLDFSGTLVMILEIILHPQTVGRTQIAKIIFVVESKDLQESLNFPKILKKKSKT